MKIIIYFFSGTGMTEAVIQKLELELLKLGIEVDCQKIEKTARPEIEGYDYLGIAYPVHSFNAPKIVVDFIKRFPQSSMDIFIINTAGEDVRINYAASNLIMRILTRKGYNILFDKLIAMPSNFIVRYSDDKVKHLLSHMNDAIPSIAQELIAKKTHRYKPSVLVKILAVVGRLEWFGAKLLGKLFYVKQNCNQCGICIRHCPNSNISKSEKKVKFDWKCGLCMRCVYNCPNHSIRIHKPFQFICINNWYFNKK